MGANQPRRPAGTPSGGQWMPAAHDEADVGVLGDGLRGRKERGDAATASQAAHASGQQLPPSPDITIDGRRPRVVLDQSGWAGLVLVDDGEEWVPETPDGAMTLEEALALAPSERAGSWGELEMQYRRYETKAFDALVASLREHGMLTPVEIDPVAKRVERGHHRLVAARVAGLPNIPYVLGRREERWEWDPKTGRHAPYVYDLDAFDDEED